jgi:hypothetical protein
MSDTGRDWKTKPPKTKEEGLEFLVHLHRKGMEEANQKYGYGGRVERRGNLIIHVYPDGTEDVYQMGAEFLQ